VPAIGSVPSNQTSGNMPYSKTYVFILIADNLPVRTGNMWESQLPVQITKR